MKDGSKDRRKEKDELGRWREVERNKERELKKETMTQRRNEGKKKTLTEMGG
jgi:hypothetical protein